MVSFPELFGIRSWKIQYVGLNALKPIQAEGVKRITEEYYKKIKVFIPQDANIRYFSVEIKLYEEPLKQKRIKYSVHARLAMPSNVFSAENADFDLNTAISYCLREMLGQVKKFKEKTRERWSEEGKGRRKIFNTLMKEEKDES